MLEVSKGKNIQKWPVSYKKNQNSMVTRCTIGVQCPSNLQFSYKDKGGNSKDNFGFMCFRKKEEFYHNVTKLINIISFSSF